VRGVRLAPEGTVARNPSVDVIPSDLVTAVVTEAGVLPAPYAAVLAAAADRSRAGA
jgi:methylthioribose-1-phosphate isomerase